MRFAQLKIWSLACLAVLSAGSLSSCLDTGSPTEGLAETTPSVDPNDGTAKGDFPGCLSGRAIDNRQIQIDFEIPPGASKMTIYRDGVIAYSSTMLTTTSFIDPGLAEGQSYHYTCEATISRKRLVGQTELDVATLSINPPTFDGIDASEVLDAHSVKISWLTPSSSGVSAAYYLIYLNLGTSVDFSKPYYEKVSSATFEKTITGLGSQLPYSFGVRACSATNKCDKNVRKEIQTLWADPAFLPNTPGITKADLVDGQAILTAPWTHPNGAVKKRHLFMREGNGSFALKKTIDVSATSADYTNPPQTIKLPDPKVPDYFKENTTYTFALVDLDPSRGDEDPTQYFDPSGPSASFTTPSDLKAPIFTGLSDVVAGVPSDTAILVKWLAIEHQPAVATGASHYLIYLTSSTAPTTMPSDPCLAQTPVAEVAASGTQGSMLSYQVTGLTQRTAYRVCVKARDLAGNISDTSFSKPITTRDITPPAFDGVQAAWYESDAIQLRWNMSGSSDLKHYRVKISKNGGATVTLNNRSAVPTNIDRTSIPKSEFSMSSGDTITVTVDACDNSSTTYDWQSANFNSADVCSTTNPATPFTIPDSDAPAGFQGVDLPATCSTAAGQGTMRVQWITPASWADYRGFKVYTEDSPGAFTLRKVCACSGANCPDQITSCVVDGLDVYKWYKFHVSAYDAASPANETALPVQGNPGSSCRTSDTTSPEFNWGSGLNYQDPDGMALSWVAATDTQKDPEATIRYEVWRKADSTFTGLAAQATVRPSDGAMLTLSDDTALSFLDPLAGLVSGKTYYYAVYAKDASGNIRLGGILNATVPDKSAPLVSDITVVKPTDPNAAWSLTWTMSDNTPSDSLTVTVRLNKRTGVPDGTAFPLETDTSNKILVKTGAQLPLTPATLGADTYGFDGQLGDPDSETYYYYLVTVEDTEGNKTSSQRMVFSDRLGPMPTANVLGWMVGASKVTTDTVTASTSAMASWIKAGTDTSAMSQQVLLVYASETGLKCDGSPSEVPINKADETRNVALPNDGSTYSYRIRSVDAAGNATESACSSGMRTDRTGPSLVQITTSVADGVYRADSVIPIQFVFSEPVDVVKGTEWPSLKLDLTDSDPIVLYKSGSGTNTLVFEYTVANGDRADNLEYVPLLSTPFNLNGSTIKDAALHTATVSLPEAGTSGSLGFGHSRRISARGPGNPKIVIDPMNETDWTGATYTTSDVVLLKVSADGPPAEMSISDGTTCDGAWEPYAQFTPSHPVLADVDHKVTVSVKFRDAEQNESSCVSDTIIQDNEAPAVVITAPEADRVFGTAPITIQGDCETGLDVTITNGAGTTLQVGCLAGGFTGQIALGAEGANTVSVAQTDPAGNAGSNERRFFRDSTAPAIPSALALLAPLTSPGRDATPTIVVSGVASGDTVSLHTDSSCSIVSEKASGTATGTTIELTPTVDLPEASYTFYAKSVDGSGNTGGCSTAKVDYRYDNTPPSAPSSLALVAPATSPGKSATPTIRVNGVSSGDTVGIYTEATCTAVAKASGAATGTSIDLTSSTLGEATYAFYAKATDQAGNVSTCSAASVSYQYDKTAPAAPSGLALAPPATSPSNVSTPSIRVSGVSSGDTVAIFTSDTCASDQLKGSATATGTTVDVPSSALAEAGHTFYAKATDAAGNESPCSAANVSYRYDNTGPTQPGAISGPIANGGNWYRSTVCTPLFAWNTSTDANSGLKRHEIAIGTTAGGTQLVNWTDLGTDTSGQFCSLTLASGTTYHVSVRAIDNAGNLSTLRQDSWTVDTGTPAIPANVGDGTSSTSLASSPVIGWSSTTDAVSGIDFYEVAIGTTAGAVDVMNWTSVGNATSGSFGGLSLVDGATYYATVRATDKAGNVSDAGLGNGWLVDTTPTTPTVVESFESGSPSGTSWAGDAGTWTTSAAGVVTKSTRSREGTSGATVTTLTSTGVYMEITLTSPVPGNMHFWYSVTGYVSDAGDVRVNGISKGTLDTTADWVQSPDFSYGAGTNTFRIYFPSDWYDGTTTDIDLIEWVPN